MIKIWTLLMLVMTCLAKQSQMHELLQHTQTINYTFYHVHQYQDHDKYGVLISIKQTDVNSDEALLKVNDNYEKLTTLLKPLGFVTNLTSKSQELGQKAEIQWAVQILADRNVTSLRVLLDQLSFLTKNNTNLFIWSVFKHGREIVDKEIESTKAREAADKKGKKICDQHLGWQFKEMTIFVEVVLQNEKKRGLIVGDYVKLLETIEQYENQESNEAIYRCQIICGRRNSIDLSLLEKQNKRKVKKQMQKRNKQQRKKEKKQKKSKKNKNKNGKK